MDLYQDLILDHAKRPRFAGLRAPFDAEVHHVNPTCGDEVTLRLTLQGDVVADISYDALGCSISTASASMMAEELTGRPLSEALEVVAGLRAMMTSRGADAGDAEVIGDAVALAGVAKYPARVKCGLLAWMAFLDALGRTPNHPLAEGSPS